MNKLTTLILSLFAVTAFGADAEADRAEAREFLELAYQSEMAREYCMAKADGVVEVEVKNLHVPVDCAVWHLWQRSRK